MDIGIASALQIAIWIALAYALLVLLIELVIWRVQPAMDGEVRMRIQQGDDAPIERVVFGLELDGVLYVSSNHWFRRWYHAAIDAGEIQVTFNGEQRQVRVEPVSGSERARVGRDYRMGFWLRLLCGFAPSRFLKLEAL